MKAVCWLKTDVNAVTQSHTATTVFQGIILYTEDVEICWLSTDPDSIYATHIYSLTIAREVSELLLPPGEFVFSTWSFTKGSDQPTKNITSSTPLPSRNSTSFYKQGQWMSTWIVHSTSWVVVEVMSAAFHPTVCARVQGEVSSLVPGDRNSSKSTEPWLQ